MSIPVGSKDARRRRKEREPCRAAVGLCAQLCSAAPQQGHAALLRWAQANGCPWDERTCAGIADLGRLDMLQWARAHGCPWNAHTRNAAAFSRHLEVQRWAGANGCRCDKSTCRYALDRGQSHMLQWARENKYENMSAVGFGGWLRISPETARWCAWCAKVSRSAQRSEDWVRLDVGLLGFDELRQAAALKRPAALRPPLPLLPLLPPPPLSPG
ncbi:hypothetical protein JKP88DRAFT_333580 [Tribonema minus]|uniref:Uncharacterized protein n=1 Tax=Tribonema minus TaxID=303371 RepID=A0A835YU52_9STRA|nr:hypothetical protein JKP88DRAFT_333580 [Tribonema minus]